MRSRSTPQSEKSNDSLRDDFPSPQTPLDASGDIMHSPAAVLNQPLLQQFPLGQNYSLPANQDCIDHFGTHANHTPYTNGGVQEHLRGDSDLGVGQANLNGIRPLVHRPAHDTHFHTGSLPESASGSISTSPSSNTSSLAYSFPASNIYSHSNTPSNLNSLASPYPTASQVYPSNISYQNRYNSIGKISSISSITDPSIPVYPPPSRQPQALVLPVSPQPSVTIRDHYTTSTPGLSRHMISPRSLGDPLARSSYNSIPETPRSMISSTSMMSPTGTYGVSYSPSTPDARHVETPPFASQEDLYEIHCEGQIVKPTIEAKIEKGFFYSADLCWTCYRRNYFSVQCSYTLNPSCSGRALFLSRGAGKPQEQIQAMAMCLSAAVDGSAGKNIELVQHTPKRDKGPQTAIQITKLAPTPTGGKPHHLHHDSQGYSHGLPSFGQNSGGSNFSTPYLPLQGVPDPASMQNHGEQQSPSPTAHQHTFERIQFKSATANNGKRRAQQQYYHLIIELYVDVRQSTHERAAPIWVKVAQRASEQVVVRGRSPSHYSNEGPHSTGSQGAGGSAGGSGMGGMGGGAGGTGGYPSSTFRSIGYGAPSYGLGATYRGGNQYSQDHSPVEGKSDSSSSSIGGRHVDTFPEQGRSIVLSPNGEDEDKMPIENLNGYHYYPSPLYEAGLQLPIINEGQNAERSRVKEASGLFGSSNMLTGGLSRFQGVDSSRGFYTSDVC